MILRDTPNGCLVLSGSAVDLSVSQLADGETILYREAVEVPALVPGKRFKAAVTSRARGESSFSIVNPSETETARVTMRFTNGGGEETGTRALTIPPLNSTAGYIGELGDGPEIPIYGVGTVTFESEIPIAVGGILSLPLDGLWVGTTIAPLPAE